MIEILKGDVYAQKGVWDVEKVRDLFFLCAVPFSLLMLWVEAMGYCTKLG